MRPDEAAAVDNGEFVNVVTGYRRSGLEAIFDEVIVLAEDGDVGVVVEAEDEVVNLEDVLIIQGDAEGEKGAAVCGIALRAFLNFLEGVGGRGDCRRAEIDARKLTGFGGALELDVEFAILGSNVGSVISLSGATGRAGTAGGIKAAR